MNFTIGSKQMRKFREDFRIKYTKEIDIEETDFDPKQKARRINRLGKEAMEYHDELGRNFALLCLFLGIVGFIDSRFLGNLIPIIGDNSFLTIFLMVIIPFTYTAIETPMRQIVIEIISYKNVSPRNKRRDLAIMEAWNKSLKGIFFLAGVCIISLILRIFPRIYDKGLEILMKQASREKSKWETLRDSVKSLFQKIK